MGKRPTQHNEDDMEISIIREQLDRLESSDESQAQALKEILILLRGSVAMGVQGIIKQYDELRNQVNQLTSDLAHYERWRQKQISDKGKITITVSTMVQRILAFIGAGGTIVGIILGLRDIFSK